MEKLLFIAFFPMILKWNNKGFFIVGLIFDFDHNPCFQSLKNIRTRKLSIQFFSKS